MLLTYSLCLFHVMFELIQNLINWLLDDDVRSSDISIYNFFYIWYYSVILEPHDLQAENFRWFIIFIFCMWSIHHLEWVKMEAAKGITAMKIIAEIVFNISGCCVIYFRLYDRQYIFLKMPYCLIYFISSLKLLNISVLW